MDTSGNRDCLAVKIIFEIIERALSVKILTIIPDFSHLVFHFKLIHPDPF